jgi:hypothetical protein
VLDPRCWTGAFYKLWRWIAIRSADPLAIRVRRDTAQPQTSSGYARLSYLRRSHSTGSHRRSEPLKNPVVALLLGEYGYVAAKMQNFLSLDFARY